MPIEITQVDQVTVTNNPISLVTGATAQLTAVASYQGQAVSGVSIAWSTSDATVATVSGTGLVTAQSVTGGVTVAATATGFGVSGQVSFTVVSSAPSVASVTISPTSIALYTNQQTSVTAIVRDSGGSILLGQTVTWSVLNTAVATVGADSGVDPHQATVQATGQAGSTTVQATCAGVIGSATLTTSIPSNSGLPNLPAGMTLLTFQDWSTKPSLLRRYNDPGNWHNSDQSSVTNTDVVAKPSGLWDTSIVNVLEVRYPGGWAGGTAPDNVYYVFPTTVNAQEVYVHYQVRISDDYLMLNTQNKSVWFTRKGDEGSNGFFFQWRKNGTYAPANDQGTTNDAYFSFQGQSLGHGPTGGPGGTPITPLPSRAAGANQGFTVNFNNGTATVRRVEIYLRVNTPGLPDGILRVWIDGQLYMNYQDQAWFQELYTSGGAGRAIAFSSFRFEGQYGGGSTPVPGGSQYELHYGPPSIYIR